MVEALRSTDLMSDLIKTARGEDPPDLIVHGGHVVNVFLGEIEDLDVVVRHGRIVALVEQGTQERGPDTELLDADGSYVVPGLIDAHYHMGGTHLNVGELASALLAHGTTSIATDFYEMYTVGGPEAVRYALDQAARCGLEVLYLPPAHLVGLENVGTFGWDVGARDMIEMLGWSEAVGVMEPPASAVLTGNPEVMSLLDEVRRLGKVFAGHHPGGNGRDLMAYLSTGASSDHESRTAEEALRKLRLGMRTMMRHGSAAPDLVNLVELVERYPIATRFMMFCSDETDPADLVDHGHMDTKVRLAVASGVDPLVALQMCTINVAEYFNVSDRVGAVAPGRYADLTIARDLSDFRPHSTLSKGRVADSAALAGCDSAEIPPQLRSQVVVPASFGSSSFIYPAPANAEGTVTARVFEVEDGSLVSKAVERSLKVTGGQLRSSPDSDILKMVVAERHRNSGRMGQGFVQGFGFEDGAVAMTYCHVFQNLLVIGSSDNMMAQAANDVVEMGGGISVVNRGEITAHWPLPVVGVISDRSINEVRYDFDAINSALHDIGCALTSPILSLSFVALPTIPAYGLTDRGLYDVEHQRFVELLV